mgnify:CR=1 FL=1
MAEAEEGSGAMAAEGVEILVLPNKNHFRHAKCTGTPHKRPHVMALCNVIHDHKALNVPTTTTTTMAHLCLSVCLSLSPSPVQYLLTEVYKL